MDVVYSLVNLHVLQARASSISSAIVQASKEQAHKIALNQDANTRAIVANE